MKVETKYDVGQTVYFATNFRPCKGKIEEVSIQIDGKEPKIQYRVTDESDGIFSGLYDEEYLYTSLAELRKAIIFYVEDIYDRYDMCGAKRREQEEEE